MLKKILGLPLHLLRKARGGDAPAPVAARTTPVVRPARPAPTVAAEAGRDHGHSHGHSHDHGHDHGHGADDEAAAPAATPKADVKIEVADTPNPNARKFTVSATVIEKGSMSLQNSDEAAGHPLGKAIFAVPGVKGVFAVKDFVTVTKEEAADWGPLTPKLVDAIKIGLAARVP